MTANDLLNLQPDTAPNLHNELFPGMVDDTMQAVEKAMFEVVDSTVEILRDASRHILGAGGKRIRPRLVLYSFAAAGGKDMSRALPVAAAVELVHTASVVHDDINDHGVLRRGRPSVNSLWGRTFALLTGDFLFTKVYELMAPYKDLNILLADATVALVEGETLQASAVKNNTLSREIYLQIIARKTAALFKAGAEMGATLANAAQEQVDALGRYGFNIGLAFQIIDDILDLTSNETQLGKTAGLDLEQGKGLAFIDNGHDGLNAIRSKAAQMHVVEEGRRQARELVDYAIAELVTLSPSDGRSALIDLAERVVNRTF